MAYPSRVAWRFRNVTAGVDFWPTLDSIVITEANPQDIATLSCDVVDPGAVIAFDVEDEVRVTCGGDVVFAGRVKSRTLAYRSEAGPRAYRIEAQDFTSKLDDSVIDQRRSRAAESGASRLAWVLSFLDFVVTTSGVDLPAGDVDTAEMDGMTVREALDALADELRLSYFVDFDKDLHMFRTETVDAPFALDDLAPDYVDSFPYTDFAHTEDSVELANAAYVQGEHASAWVEDAGSIATFGRQERSVNDGSLATSSQITNAGLRANAELAQPQVDGSFTCREPGLRAGMTISLTNDLWAFSARTFIITEVTITAVDPHDPDGLAYLHCEVQYSDRRRARPWRRPAHPDREGDMEDGAAVTLDRYCLSASRDRIGAGYSGATPTPIADSVAYGLTPPGHSEVTDAAPAYRRSYLASNCPPGFQGGWTGYTVEEQWFELAIGSLSGVSAIRIMFGVADSLFTDGKDLIYGYLPATDGPPTEEIQYTELGRVSIDGGSFDIPASLLTPSATNFVCLAPGWASFRDVHCCDGALLNGLEGPLGGISPGGGEANSAQVRITSPTAVERVATGGGLNPWGAVTGDIDGINRTFGLPDWTGRGVPEVRVGAVVYGQGSDFSHDRDAATVTLNFAPWPGAPVEGRWRT